jgi:hypothetical protein
MGSCPDNDISGVKVLWVETRKVNCRAARALRMAAQSLHHSKSALGDFYRRMRAKLDAPKAIIAAAHKLARIIFHLIIPRQELDESRFGAYPLPHQKRQEINSGQRPKPWVSNSFPYNRPHEFLRSFRPPTSRNVRIKRACTNRRHRQQAYTFPEGTDQYMSQTK